MASPIEEFTSKYRSMRILIGVGGMLMAIALAYRFEYRPATGTNEEQGYKAVSTVLRMAEQLLGLFRNALSGPVAWVKSEPEIALMMTGYGVVMTALAALSKYEWLDWTILGFNALLFFAALASTQ